MAPRQQYGSISISQDEEAAPNGIILPLLQGEKPKAIPRIPSCAKFCVTALLLVAALSVGLHVQHTEEHKDSSVSDSSKFLSPEDDMKLRGIEREEYAGPSEIWGDISGPLPTNSWYLNLVSHRAAAQPDDATRVYTIPYIIDTAAAAGLSGLRVHWPVVNANEKNIQMVNDYKNGISLGTKDTDLGNGYKVDEQEDLSLLGVSLKWADDNEASTKSMVSHIVRGMPYATVRYYGGVLPSLYSYNGPASAIKVDESGKELQCGVGEEGAAVTVHREVTMHFINSDFTWALFFSKPVQVRCEVSEGGEKVRDFRLEVVSYSENEEEPLTVRLALLDQCTTGMSDIKQHCLERAEWKDQEGYVRRMRESAHVFPSSPTVDFEYPDEEAASDRNAKISFDWGARSADARKSDLDELIMFALPHHQEQLDTDSVENTEHCINTFHGSTCIVKGSKWLLMEDVGEPMSFTARRPPEATSIPALADALSEDIDYRLSSNMLRGAADTYFSSKILARLGRVVMIAAEMKKLAAGPSALEELKAMYDGVGEEELSLSMEAAAAVELPSDETITAAVEQLRKGVEIWLSDKAEAPYVYDRSWGGLVNCGCRYEGEGELGVCTNTFPDCPALADVNVDFGNGFYNDHHFHYGYQIYAAAVVAKFDPEWGEKYFERVQLLIRDISNPTPDDQFFTQFRQKDWFLGSSWASGIISAENSPHGRDQESSSEAIAAYEAVALYGSAMVDSFSSKKAGKDRLKAAKLIRDAGQLLVASEVHAAHRYWHVWSSDTHASTYPKEYTRLTVGMLYDTMASFQTWFSPKDVVSYGIQLMPLTPVAESRDTPEWAATLYPVYEESCQEAGDFCIDNGWSILQAGLLAETGDREKALEQALSIPSIVFNREGGVGNSLSNTIWFIGTRKPIDGDIM